MESPQLNLFNTLQKSKNISILNTVTHLSL